MLVSLWDLGNVVVNWDPQGILASLDWSAEDINVFRQQLLEHRDWQLLDKGVIDPAEVRQRLIEKCGLSTQQVDEGFSRTLDLLYTIDATVELMRAVKADGQRLYCLSNMSHATYDYLQHREFFSLFDGMVISAQEQLIKPDPKIFELVLQRFDLNAKDVLFIDDSLPNIETAAACGIDGVHFKRSADCYRRIRTKLSLPVID